MQSAPLTVPENSVEALSETWISFTDPQECSFVITDIAAGLSKLCRFCGQIDTFFSVAEHSVNVYQLAVAKQCNWHTRMYALMHDASEAYIGDIPRPAKQLLPDYRKLEARLMLSICKAFRIDRSQVDFEAVHAMDMEAYRNEAREYKPQQFSAGKCKISTFIDVSEPLSCAEAYRAFLDSYDEVMLAPDSQGMF